MKHILITGASSGIGRALAIIAAKQGYKLSICGRNPEKLNQTVSMLEQQAVFQRAFCVSDLNQIEQFVDDAVSQNGLIDVLINCAGLNSARAQAHELEIAQLDWMMKINCYAPIAFCQAAIPNLTSEAAKIVNVLSTVCLYSNMGIAGYTASKAALDAYTKVMRKELRSKNIHITSVYPGGVNTDFRDVARPQYLSAEDVAQVILANLNTSDLAHLHELVIRPQSEENFV